MHIIRASRILLLAILPMLAAWQPGLAQESSEETDTGGQVDGETQEETRAAEEELPTEESSEERGPLDRLRLPVLVKNMSSFRKRLSAYDDVCRRYVIFAEEFKGFETQRIEICADLEGYGQVTLTRPLGARKKRYEQVEVGDVLKIE